MEQDGNITEPAANPPPSGSSRTGANLRVTGIVVLVVGLAAAALIYFTAPPAAEDYSSEPDTAAAYKSGLRDTEENFGKMGLFVNDLWDDLSHPGVQALLIAGGAILVAGGCFYFARWFEGGDEPS